MGVVCNENLDRFGELKPECGASCDGMTTSTPATTAPTPLASPASTPSSVPNGQSLSSWNESMNNSSATTEATPPLLTISPLDGVNNSHEPTDGRRPMRPSLCVPMGHEAVKMAEEMERFREMTNRQFLKMYLETSDKPPFCRL